MDTVSQESRKILCVGHDSESTARIYPASLDTSVVDKANRVILKLLPHNRTRKYS